MVNGPSLASSPAAAALAASARVMPPSSTALTVSSRCVWERCAFGGCGITLKAKGTSGVLNGAKAESSARHSVHQLRGSVRLEPQLLGTFGSVSTAVAARFDGER